LSTLTIPTAKVFLPLIEPARYKGAWGGRGSGKSHFFADLTLEDALRFPGDYGEGMRMVCIREVQKDLKHSAKQLIQDKMQKYDITGSNGFKLFNDRIELPGDGIILFQGMQDYNADSIKSLEKFHRAWVEEGQTLSQRSLELLRPTIRAEMQFNGNPKEIHNSEMWFSWNPSRKSDPVDRMLRQGALPTDSVVVKANWKDNPWFPGVLDQERTDCLSMEPDQYDHVWDGGYVAILKGAYYARQMAVAKREGRICKVSADPYLPVRLFMDIGGAGTKSDAFTIWAAQFVDREIRVLNYYEARGQEISDHLGWMHKNDYGPENAHVWLPHDGGTSDKVYRVSYESEFRSAGYRVRVVPNQGTGAAIKRIERSRKLFPQMWFNRATTAGGIDALSWYHEKLDEVRGIGLGPEHDWSSHGADGFGLMCIAYEKPHPGGIIHKPKVIRSMAGKTYRT
jgi:phage terminase large subunit